MKKRYARILAATLSAAMVFTSAPTGFVGLDLGVIEAKAEATKLGVPTVAAFTATTVDEEYDSMKSTVGDYITTEPTFETNEENGTIVATGKNVPVTVAGVSDAEVTYYALLNNEAVEESDPGSGDYFLSSELNGWIQKSGEGDPTVIPDGRYYKQIATVSVTVSAQGKATQVQLDALFPTELKIAYGETDIAEATGWPSGKTASDYAFSDIQNLKDLTVNDSLMATLKIDADPNYDWEGLTGYKDGVITKSVKVTCVAAADASGVDVSTTDEPQALKAHYGANDVTVYGTYIDEGNSNNAVSKKWTLKSVKDAVKTADANTQVDAEIQSVQVFDATKYDMKAYCENLGTAYSFENGRIVKKVKVDIIPALVDPDTIVFPTTTTTVTVGDDYSKITLPKYGSEKYGEYYLAADNTFAKLTTGDKTAQITDKAVNIVFELDDNYAYKGDSAYAKYDVVGNTLQYANGFKVSVQKKTITAKDVAPQLTVEKLPYGSTVADVEAALAANAYVTYKPVAAGTTKLKTGKQKVDFVATISPATFATTSFAGNNDEMTVSVEVEVVTPAIAVELMDGVNPATSVGIAINASKTIGVAIAEGKDGDDYIKTNAQIKSYQWYVVENGTAKAIPDEKGATLTITPKVAATRQYYCEVVLEAKGNAKKDDTKALLSSSAIATNKITVYSSKFTMTTGGATDGATYKNTGTFEDITASLNTHTGYSVVAKEASYKDEAGKVTATSITNTDDAFTIAVPTTLEAGKYEFTAKVTLESNTTDETDTVYFVEGYEVEQATILLTDLHAKKKNELDAKLDKTSYVYGTKTSDMVLTSGTTLGTLKIATSNPDYFDVGDQNIALTYVPNAFAEKNYTKASIDALNLDPGLIVATEIKKAPLTITADNLELVVGDAKPAETKLTYKYDGVVAKDEFAKLGATVTLSYAPTVTDEMLAKVGTIKEGIRITATVLNGNYEVKAVRGDIIITDGKAPAPTTPPTVAPTPAPVKQATAAAPKAAKAKATVKVGKKYTLKLKYAAGKKATVKKVTWKSSKKSVATVSSKGKVTAKKAGKATITATITFKDGSKKKVKFTVTVK